MPLYPKGSRVNLSDGRGALIFENSGEHNLRPVLLMEDGSRLDLLDAKNLNITILQEG